MKRRTERALLKRNTFDRSGWNALPQEQRHELGQHLTGKQFDVYVLWLAGCSYKRISEMLTISPRTVRTHLDRAKHVHSNLIEGD